MSKLGELIVPLTLGLLGFDAQPNLQGVIPLFLQILKLLENDKFMSDFSNLPQLQQAGLLVKFNQSGPYKNGFTIAKPFTVKGNNRENYEILVGDDEIFCDAPCAKLFPKDTSWIFEIWECIPGPGPGDFQLEFSSIDEGISAILKYYFGE